jgi:RNA polymerase sigma-70 factor (ECF subfamily)
LNTIAALREGDEIIFEAVFHEYHERIYAYILRKTQSPYLAEETTQLTFIKLWQHRAGLSDQYDLFTQLFRIARTTMIDLLRKQHSHQLLWEKAGKEMAGVERGKAIEQLAEKELRAKLMVIISKMPPVRRQIFTMSRIEHMSAREIAAALSLSVKTVEGHITKAIKELKRLLPTGILLLGITFF